MSLKNLSPPHVSRHKLSTYILSSILVFVLLAAIFAGGHAMLKKELTPIKVRLSWLHTVEFSGFYLAKELGYYEKEGLDVTFEPVDFEKTTIADVSDGNAQFGITSLPEIIQARQDKKPIKAIFAIYQKSPVVLISLKSSNITKPQDLNGKTIALDCGFNGEISEIAFLKKYSITYTKACVQNSLTQLVDRKVDVAAGFLTNEPFEYESKGYPINYILLSEYGVNSYPNLIFATDDYLEKNPKIAEKFLRATEKGMEYSIEHDEEAIDATLKYDPSLDRDVQLKTMETQTPLIFDGTAWIGWMRAESIGQTRQMLVDQHLLDGSADIEEAYTNSFLEKIYSDR
jgi:NitT/TauT family transport system substrate-binding protein